MGLFSSLFAQPKSAPGTLLAPIGGTVLPLSSLSDPAFSSGMLGAGCVIEGSEGVVRAPTDGCITSLPKTFHAVGLTTADGAELLLHIGVDTVSLGGKGFEALVTKGQSVRCGQPLLRFDRKAVAAAGLPGGVILTVLNGEDFSSCTFSDASPVSAGDIICRYSPAEKEL